ncbi:MAG: AraC family transcriptional regulator [Gemmatimonadales bacterium]
MVSSAAGVYDVPPATRFHRHHHEGLHLCAVLRGGFREWQGRDTRTVEPGYLRLSPSAAHDIHFSTDGARCLLVEFSSEDATALRRAPRCSAFITDPWLTTLVRRLETALQPGSSHAAAHDLTLELLAQLSRRESGRAAGPPPAWLLTARDHLADSWRHPPPADALARNAGVHRVHLVRSFRDYFGCTLRGYVRRRRIAHAMGLLRQGTLPLSQVAAEAAFADQAHLTRELHRATGMTPLEFRRQGGGLVTSVQDLPRRHLLA